MKKSRSFEKEIAAAVRQARSRVVTGAEICRRLGVLEVSFNSWKKRFAGMDVTGLRKLRQLEEINRKLKALVPDLTLDKHMLQEVIAKKL